MVINIPRYINTGKRCQLHVLDHWIDSGEKNDYSPTSWFLGKRYACAIRYYITSTREDQPECFVV